MTRKLDLAEAQAETIAKRRGHDLGLWEMSQAGVKKRIAQCQTCQALAMVELDGSKVLITGGTQAQDCKSVLAEKARHGKT